MEWGARIVNYFKRKEAGEDVKAPEGVCPNCWGKQEYDGVVRDIFKDHQVDVNAGRENYAFIQDFVVNQMDGIKLKNTVHGLECPTCRFKAG